MKTNNKPVGTGAIVGVGAAACAACCVGPIIGLVSALGIGTALSGLIFGAAGLIIAGAVALLLVHRRRRGQRLLPLRQRPTAAAPVQLVSRAVSSTRSVHQR